ncbi:YlaH-like family protein [Aquibacillus koreensis]|uniref:YlaH-like family protein n=1 Tax=Aquibacillus koreensis TaxID=279446 RepID=A0A9X3WIK2_9BACI|nr:YlaH-like family protein [Aquibacillus koreensis]MCT2538104.1 YlaH-like family protein [Aquibacillus koreensis]MDC3420627.1 YlaH-like family protein [Aquibacillus koreensis]
MGSQMIMDVPDNLWPVAKFFLQDLGNEVNFNDENDVTILVRGFFFLYITIVILTILAYKFGFAKKLPPLKSVVVYIILIIGTFFITLIFGLNLPVAESLAVIAFVLGIYRFRLYGERKSRNITED